MRLECSKCLLNLVMIIIVLKTCLETGDGLNG